MSDDPPRGGTEDAIGAGLALLALAGVAVFVIVNGFALILIFIPWVPVAVIVCLVVGLAVLRRRRDSLPLGLVAAVAFVVLGVAVAIPSSSGASWWADLDHQVRGKTAEQLDRQRDDARAEHREELRDWRRGGRIGAKPERETVPVRWGLLDTAEFNAATWPPVLLVRWVVAGLALATLTACLTELWRAPRRRPAEQPPQLGGITTGARS